jgi:hypothetical protein
MQSDLTSGAHYERTRRLYVWSLSRSKRKRRNGLDLWYATTGDWQSEENFLGEPGEIGLAPLEEARDGIDQDAKGR